MVQYVGSDFLIETVFVVIAAFVYIHPLAKREPVELRMIGAFVLAEAAFIALALLGDNTLPRICAKNCLYLFLLLILIRCCVQAGVSVYIYLSIWSLISAQFVGNLWFFWRGVTRSYLHLMGYGDVGMIVFYAAAYLLIAVTLARTMPEKGKYHIGPRQLTAAVIVLLIFELQQYLLTLVPVTHQGALFYMAVVFVQFYFLTVLYLQTELFKKSAMQKEMLTMDLLMKQQEIQYAISKENIDLINRKCHDLKHQVSALRSVADEESKEKYLSELEQSIEIYGAIVKTGNDVLDTLLTEKSLLCQANGITINCVADGSRMSFINPVDLYAILGNAVDNAMEAVAKFQQKEMRIIDIAIFTRDKFLVMNITNPVDHTPVFRNGLPVTTKSEKGYHGYGLKSIRHNVRQYGGYMTISADHGIFALKILVPLPPSAT